MLEAEVVREGPVRAAVAAGVGSGPDQVDPGAVAVVVDGFLDPVTVGVEFGTDVGQGVPLRGVLQREGHHVVGPHVDVLGISPVLHLAHADVVEDGRLALHALGGGDHRRVAALIEGGSPGVVERQAEAEADTGLDLAYTLQHLVRGEQVDAPELVVLPPVAPGRTRWSALPPRGHRVPPPGRHASRGRTRCKCTDRSLWGWPVAMGLAGRYGAGRSLWSWPVAMELAGTSDRPTVRIRRPTR